MLKELFPDTCSLVIFLTYMALFVNQGLIVTASRRGGTSYPFDPTIAVLMAEGMKLTFASMHYIAR